jgi:radical SAM-linked protein
VHSPTDPPAEGPDASSPPADPAPRTPPAPEPRQRWRLTFRRDPVPAELVGRAAIEAWQTALAESGLRLAHLDAAGRPRVAFGAPLSAAAEGEAELAEIFLAERVPAWRIREALVGRLPAGHELVAAEDVWLGAPPLPGRVAAADWRVEVERGAAEPEALRAAAERLLASSSLPRTRSKAGADKSYDLRPLLDDVRVAREASAGELLTVHVRTRFRPELGSGRPEEVVAALADLCGRDIVIRRTVRERLLLLEDQVAPSP